MLPSGHDPVITVMSSEQLQLSALDLRKTEPVSNLSWERSTYGSLAPGKLLAIYKG